MKKFLVTIVNDDKSTYYIISFFIIVSVLFSFLYFTILPFFDGYQTLQHNILNPDRVTLVSYLDCLYFSIITQTTVGYGDIIAASMPGKICSMTQSIFGYFYLAFSIAIFACKGILNSEKFGLLLRSYQRDVKGMNEHIANN